MRLVHLCKVPSSKRAGELFVDQGRASARFGSGLVEGLGRKSGDQMGRHAPEQPTARVDSQWLCRAGPGSDFLAQAAGELELHAVDRAASAGAVTLGAVAPGDVVAAVGVRMTG